jgi:tetratricopeptide (TPR) repeat protein
MGKGLHNVTVVLLITLVVNCICTLPVNAATEKSLYSEIQRAFHHKKSSRAHELVRKFYKQYPRSDYVADIRLLVADHETNPDEAIDQYRKIIKYYRYYTRRDHAQYRICSILYLLSRWGELKKEAEFAVKHFPESRYTGDFQLYLVKSYIVMNRYEEGDVATGRALSSSHAYNTLAQTLLLKSSITRHTWGYSRNYIASLSELAHGYKNSDVYPTILLLLGNFYENRKMIDHAYSTYIHVNRSYPRSPEAGYSRKKISLMKKMNPQKVHFMPDKSLIAGSDVIDIQPERDMSDGKKQAAVEYYTIALGPFYNLKRAEQIHALLKKDLSLVHITRKKNMYMIYAGRFTSSDSAIRMKIRLAEELGMNGNVAQMIYKNDRFYIYGD